MAVPPGYGDLGKAARDLFSKGFNYGFYKLEVATTTNSGVCFKTTGSSNHDTGKVSGGLETKYKLKDYGLTFVEKWNTDNTLGTEVTIEDQLAKGLKLSFDTQFAPQTGKKSGKIKTTYKHGCYSVTLIYGSEFSDGKKSGKIKSAYKQDYINVNCDVDFDFAGPTVHSAAVLGYKGWLAGYQMSFDTSKSKLTKNNFAVGYKGPDFTLHTSVNDGSEFAGSYHQKLTPELETGVQLSWTSGSNATKLGLACKYSPDENSVIRAKINNSSQIGLSYQHQLQEGISMTLSSLIEAKNFNAGGHKIGLGLDMEGEHRCC